VAVEEPLEIRLAGKVLAVLLRTPGHDDDLAVGFALSEGVLAHASEVDEVRPCAAAPAQAIGNVVEVLLRDGVTPNFSRHQQPRFSNSACGVCGSAALENLLHVAPPIVDGRTITPTEAQRAPDLLRAQQPGFLATGGLHAAGLLDDDGALQAVREDVGRHNATDKALGAWAQDRGDHAARALVVSSRAGFEIVQKAHALRVPVVVCVGAPTSLAVDSAVLAGITLLAFSSSHGFGVYAHSHRVRW
jgi:FdhD protein